MNDWLDSIKKLFKDAQLSIPKGIKDFNGTHSAYSLGTTRRGGIDMTSILCDACYAHRALYDAMFKSIPRLKIFIVHPESAFTKIISKDSDGSIRIEHLEDFDDGMFSRYKGDKERHFFTREQFDVAVDKIDRDTMLSWLENEQASDEREIENLKDRLKDYKKYVGIYPKARSLLKQ
jgi:hypothetical protein